MKVLTKKKQKEVIARMIANAIIATDALFKSEDPRSDTSIGYIIDNLAQASYIIGGVEAMKATRDAYNKRIDAIVMKEHNVKGKE